MSKPEHIGPVEWQARCELAALYRLVAHFRMTDLIDTHITLRIPGPEHHFLINRYGVIFDRMRASDLVRIDQEGRVVDPAYEGHRVNAAGFVIHSAIHMARPDLNCVIHTHTAAGMAVAAQKQGLLPISQHALKFYGKLAYHTYEGIALSLDERERLIADLGPHRAMILRNHGLLVGVLVWRRPFRKFTFWSVPARRRSRHWPVAASCITRRQKSAFTPPNNSTAMSRTTLSTWPGRPP